MLTVVIPTKNSEEALARTLVELVPAAAEGIVREVIVVDGGSSDATDRIADATGCQFVTAPGDLGSRLASGADASLRGEWLMFLPPGVLLEAGWERDVAALVERLERRGVEKAAAVFRYGVDEVGLLAGLREGAVRIACRLSGLPHPDQGLLISKTYYRELGGFRERGPLSAVDLFRRIGRRRLMHLRVAARRVVGAEDAGLLTGSGFRERLILGLLALRIPVPVLARVFR